MYQVMILRNREWKPITVPASLSETKARLAVAVQRAPNHSFKISQVS